MRILAIGAHQDDNEFRLGGMALKWTRDGHEVRFLSMCNGSGGHHLMTPEETVARRAGESASVAKYLGITYDVWDIEDCTLMPTLENRQRLIRYIRAFSPDLVIAHRPNDYHADHRAAGQLVQDASYILTVPHTCPDVPAMPKMPTILYYEDTFKYPPFTPSYVFDIGDVVENKLDIARLNESQVFEWLPYTYGETVPEDPTLREKFFRGMEPDVQMSDEQILSSGSHGYQLRFAKTAARHRATLIAKYGEERGRAVRYAEAFELCEYGRQPDEEFEKELFGY